MLAWATHTQAGQHTFGSLRKQPLGQQSMVYVLDTPLEIHVKFSLMTWVSDAGVRYRLKDMRQSRAQGC